MAWYRFPAAWSVGGTERPDGVGVLGPAATHPRSMNRILYAEANPWTLVDLSGHWAYNLDRGIGEEGAYLAQDLEETRAYAALAKLTKQGVYRAHAERAAHTYVAHVRQMKRLATRC
jgi:hypothetical protein